ncbi:PTS transporter subunit EIIC [Enorma phocaeensis]
MAKGAEKAITFYPFGILWKIMGYKGSMLPALLVAIIGAKTERGLRRIVPDAGGTIAQATAALVTGFKMRDPKKRGFYMSASLPAFMGITEPAIFGVNLRFGRPFLFALCGGAAAGFAGALLGAASTGMGVAAIPGIVTYLYSAEAIRNYFIIHGVGMLVSGLLCWFFFDPNKAEAELEAKKAE